MTKEELIAVLKDIADHHGYDPEASHVDGERALLKFVNDPEITAAWKAAEKFWWYA